MDSLGPFQAFPGPQRASQFPSFSVDTRRLYPPRRARPLRTPAASGTVIGFVTSGCLAALDFVSRGQIEFAYATAHVFAPQGFTPHSCPAACLWDYMANGSFHGDLLSDHKTTIVSLTHQMNADERRFKLQQSTIRDQTSLPPSPLSLVTSFLRHSPPHLGKALPASARAVLLWSPPASAGIRTPAR